MVQGILVTGNYYHVFTRSIAEFVVFRNEAEFLRMREALRYYQRVFLPDRFSRVFSSVEQRVISSVSSQTLDKGALVQIVAYCLMPTHLHLFLRQEAEHGVSVFMARILNSYTRYFNVKTRRKGPLWESKFNRVGVESDEQALHLTRYLHLNPSSAGLVSNPADWKYSSYTEYLGEVLPDERMCEHGKVNSMDPVQYRKFVEEHREEQRQRACLKARLFR
jgi:putative transposase